MLKALKLYFLFLISTLLQNTPMLILVLLLALIFTLQDFRLPQNLTFCKFWLHFTLQCMFLLHLYNPSPFLGHLFPLILLANVCVYDQTPNPKLWLCHCFGGFSSLKLNSIVPPFTYHSSMQKSHDCTCSNSLLELYVHTFFMCICYVSCHNVHPISSSTMPLF